MDIRFQGTYYVNQPTRKACEEKLATVASYHQREGVAAVPASVTSFHETGVIGQEWFGLLMDGQDYVDFKKARAQGRIMNSDVSEAFSYYAYNIGDAVEV